ncbi:phage terminase large subunit family protein [Marinomonas mediterranea]|uniref:Terminase GpA n=1 Tax=Marinomonas mediterranea (strain ATCC 700492 / JCM 21426 / NBRC 103028 / MMB-1) TaxID=717774 RepID=F2K1G0_MARM1|nr:terminase gpA endonuclease subunit [Marinomonas mediterranea]ADZ91091.1 terminase GpA [Marinomonas mediterranea MMB-1]WCN13152.1 phage terminase large subunit family protein [Marinomonas mediterranea]WCN17223.1 phage terminase large subunit family protein [Marinomonas mediterranea MMB-1]
MYASANSLKRDTALLIKPPTRLAVSEAVAQYVKTKTPSGNWDYWDIETAPYMVEPMDIISSRKKKGLIFVGPARSGKTQALIDGGVGYGVAVDPSDMLVAQMSQVKAAEFGKKRITPMLENSPILADCLSPRTHDNNVTEKIFKAGNYLRIGHPSKTILASSDYRFVFLTDYDRWPLDVGGEGSGWGLAFKRIQTYQSLGMAVCESSPGYEVMPDGDKNLQHHEAPASLGILSLYNTGDRRQLYWACLDCGEFFPAKFEYLRFDENETNIRKAARNVTAFCPHCGSNDIKPQHKFELIQKARWVPGGCEISRDGEITGEMIDSPLASFWMEGPAANFQTWEELVYLHLSAKRDYDKTGSEKQLRTTVNVDQGRPYTPMSLQAKGKAEELKERVVPLEQLLVPKWVRFLTAQIDVQNGKKSRFSVMVLGWGEGLQHTVIDRFEIVKSNRVEDGQEKRVDPAKYSEDWDLITDRVINQSYQIEDHPDLRMPITITLCDSGGEDGVTDNAYEYYRRLKKLKMHEKFWLLKGDGKKLESDYIRVSYPDNSKKKHRKARARGDIPLLLLNSNRFKDIVNNSSIGRDEPGAKYCYFPDWLPESFYDELTYEIRGVDGRWTKPGKKANEAFDQFYYGWAAIYQLRAHTVDWELPPVYAKPIEENPFIIRPNQLEKAHKTKRERRSRIQIA